MEDARASIMANSKSLQPRQWRLRTFLLRYVIAKPMILRFAIFPLRIYSKIKLQSLFRNHISKWFPKRLANLEALIPEISSKSFRRRGILASPEKASARVALIMGCVQGEMFPQTHEATIGVLEELGCEVIAPPSQVCCGALHLHAGDMQKSRELAKKNIEVFEEYQVDAILVNAAGCGSTLKEYGHLLREDDKWAKRATAFSNQVQDILEFVEPRMQNNNLQKNLSTLNINVTLQDSCHLAHAQGIREAPRKILNQIPGLSLHEMRNPDRCCGSAGIYSLVQSEMSNNILATKMEDIVATESSIICTANPGCTLQLQSGVRQSELDAEVLHVIDLLYRSLSQK
jgi:glycolate oxidase iron-sulfur subunit